MTRLPTKDANGNLTFTEEALDLDGDEIFLELVEVESVNGAPPPTPNPSWLTYTSSQELLANGQRKLTVELTVVPDSLVPGDVVVFGLECRDAYSESVRNEVTLTIGEIAAQVAMYIVSVENDNRFRFYDADGNETKTFGSVKVTSDLIVDEANEYLIYSSGNSDDTYRIPLDATDDSNEVKIYNTSGFVPDVFSFWYAENKIISASEDNNRDGKLTTMDPDGSNRTVISGLPEANWQDMAFDEKNGILFILGGAEFSGPNIDIMTRQMPGGAFLGRVQPFNRVWQGTLDRDRQILYMLQDRNSSNLVKADYDDNGNVTNQTTIVSGFCNHEQALLYVPSLDKLVFGKNGNLWMCDTDGTNQTFFAGVGGGPPDKVVYVRSFIPELQ